MNSRLLLSLDWWYHSNYLDAFILELVCWSNKSNQSKEQSWFLGQLFDIQYYLQTYLGLNSILCGCVTGSAKHWLLVGGICKLTVRGHSQLQQAACSSLHICLSFQSPKWREDTPVRHYGGDGLVTKSCPTLPTPWTLRQWDSLDKNTGVHCHFLLQGIFLTQELNPGLLHYRQILYQLNYEESPRWAL